MAIVSVQWPELPLVSFEGTLTRIVRADGREHLLDPRPLPTVSRFAPPGIPCLYASEDANTALAEKTAVAEFLGIKLDEMRVVQASIFAKLSNVLDLTRSDVQGELNISQDDLIRQDLTVTQAIGREAYLSGRIEAVRYPSPRRAGGNNICIFRLLSGSELRIWELRRPELRRAFLRVEESLTLTLEDGRLYVRTAGTLADFQSPTVPLFNSESRSIITALRKQFGLVTADVVQELEELLNSPTTREADFQEFFEKYPELLRYFLPFAKVYPHVLLELPGEKLVPDFILADRDMCRAIILELKLPSANLVRRQKHRDRLSASFEEARAQLLRYRDWFRETGNRQRLKDLLGLEIYEPRLAVIIGRTASFWSDLDRPTLESRSGEVQIATWDDILTFARRNRIHLPMQSDQQREGNHPAHGQHG